MQEVKQLIEEMQSSMEKTIEVAVHELATIRAGRVSTTIIENIKVEAYQTTMTLKELGNINIKDARTIVVSPWDKNLIEAIHRAILQANIGGTPSTVGDVIIVSFPPLTEETRKQLVKKVKEESEKFKVSIRNIRRNALEKLKTLKKEKSYPEDEIKRWEEEIQKITNKFISRIDEITDKKCKDIMEV